MVDAMTKNKNAIRIGVIGCGRGSRALHLPVLSRLTEFKIVALADLDQQVLQSAAGRYGISCYFTDWRDMLNSCEVEAVAVATPTASHCEIGIGALQAGKHLFMEKPLALSLAECDRIIEAADQVGMTAIVALNCRWHELVLRARSLIRTGVLGNLRSIRSVYTHCHPGETAQPWHKSRSLGGGVMINNGVHHFDLWRFLLGAEVTEIYAESLSSAHYEDDTCTLTARLDNGVLASGVFSFSTSANSELEIFGEEGRLLISLYRSDGLQFFSKTLHPGSISMRLHSASRTLQELPKVFGLIHRGGYFGFSYETLWKHFADCIGRGAQPGCTLTDGRKALQVALAAVESAQTRHPVAVTG
jgi:myo-inositol 2-dehydrogenase / D-chiro-inositol 1-dehydrogenase